jgi:short-subunit dehydrogenase
MVRGCKLEKENMNISLKPLNEQIIVLTGASSGIGLATAKAAAKRGAKLVLAARNEEALTTLVDEITKNRGEAVHVVADVGRQDDVQRIADVARERFGGFDTWINDAGVSIWGRLEEVSDEDSHRLFQTNFWGVVHGSLVALKTLRERGGALINVGSVVSDQALPLQGMYSASKHAVKGFTDALRMEVEHDSAPVSITLIKPTSVDTPFTEHARKYTPNQPNLPAPVYHPDEVAMAILYAATHPKRDIYVGSGSKLMSMSSKTMPRTMDRVGETLLYRGQLRNAPARNPQGALHSAGGGGRTRGDHRGMVMKRSFYTRASLHPVVAAASIAAVVGAGVAAAALMTKDRRNIQWD